MTRWILALGAAALAISAPAAAEKGGGPGGGGGGKGHSAQAEKHGGGGGGGHGKGQSAKGEKHGGGGGAKMDRGGERPGKGFKAEHGGGQRAERGPKHEFKADRGARADRQFAGGGRPDKAERQPRADRDLARSAKPFKRDGDGQEWVVRDRFGGERVMVVDDDRPIRIVRTTWDEEYWPGHDDEVYYGCPPGLAKKNNGCLPPGQAKKLIGQRFPGDFAHALLPVDYRSWYPDDEEYYYRYGDDYIYRIDRDDGLVDGLIPLFGDGYYLPGEPYPEEYDFYNVPAQYRPWYADDEDYHYRYGDGAIYRVNRGNGLIEAIVALLAGGLGVGQTLPTSYDAYNVPLAYRDRYYDTPDNMYRYNDGYIYQVDPQTRLIEAVISTLV